MKVPFRPPPVGLFPDFSPNFQSHCPYIYYTCIHERRNTENYIFFLRKIHTKNCCYYIAAVLGKNIHKLVCMNCTGEAYTAPPDPLAQL